LSQISYDALTLPWLLVTVAGRLVYNILAGCMSILRLAALFGLVGVMCGSEAVANRILATAHMVLDWVQQLQVQHLRQMQHEEQQNAAAVEQHSSSFFMDSLQQQQDTSTTTATSAAAAASARAAAEVTTSASATERNNSAQGMCMSLVKNDNLCLHCRLL
jgi:xanthosine utilization system XapX-like protein